MAAAVDVRPPTRPEVVVRACRRAFVVAWPLLLLRAHGVAFGAARLALCFPLMDALERRYGGVGGRGSPHAALFAVNATSEVWAYVGRSAWPAVPHGLAFFLAAYGACHGLATVEDRVGRSLYAPLACALQTTVFARRALRVCAAW